MTPDKPTIREAAIATFEYCAPFLISAAIVAIWKLFGMWEGIALLCAFVAAAGLAWRQAFHNRNRHS